MPLFDKCIEDSLAGGHRGYRPVHSALVVFVACALAAGCATPTGEQTSGSPRPSFFINWWGYDCQLNPARCDEVQNAINYLQNSGNATCAGLGYAAQARYDAQGYGFRETDDYGVMGYTVPGDSSTWLGTNQQSGNTFGNSQAANTIAHEEAHHAGYAEYEAGGGAYVIGDSCGNGYDSGAVYLE